MLPRYQRRNEDCTSERLYIHFFFFCIHPIEIQIMYEAAIRLKTMEEWINKGHTIHHQTVIQATIHSIEETI